MTIIFISWYFLTAIFRRIYTRCVLTAIFRHVHSLVSFQQTKFPHLVYVILLQVVGTLVVFCFWMIVKAAILEDPQHVSIEQPGVYIVIGLQPLCHGLQIWKEYAGLSTPLDTYDTVLAVDLYAENSLICMHDLTSLAFPPLCAS